MENNEYWNLPFSPEEEIKREKNIIIPYCPKCHINYPIIKTFIDKYDNEATVQFKCGKCGNVKNNERSLEEYLKEIKSNKQIEDTFCKIHKKPFIYFVEYREYQCEICYHDKYYASKKLHLISLGLNFINKIKNNILEIRKFENNYLKNLKMI